MCASCATFSNAISIVREDTITAEHLRILLLGDQCSCLYIISSTTQHRQQ